MLADAVHAATLASMPSGAMLLLGLVGLGMTPPKSISGALQHFAAGILLSAVAQELVPPMVTAKGIQENAAAVIGFFLGVLILIGLGAILPEPEEDEPAEPAVKEPQQKPLLRRKSTLRGSDTSLVHQAYERKRSMNIAGLSKRLIEEDGKDVPKAKGFPSALVIAVAIDSCIDGVLVGITTAADANAGTLMAVALSVEMGFLGLTMATALSGQPKSKALPAVVLGPALLLTCAGVGGFFAGFLTTNAALKIGLLSFGASALIFMVAEELLLEAHEGGEDHVWWVDIQLYVGFIFSIYLAKLLG